MGMISSYNQIFITGTFPSGTKSNTQLGIPVRTREDKPAPSPSLDPRNSLFLSDQDEIQKLLTIEFSPVEKTQIEVQLWSDVFQIMNELGASWNQSVRSEVL